MKYVFVFFLAFLFARCDTAPNPIKKELKEIAREIMTNAKNCALITIDSLGVAHARTMDPFLPEEDFTVWMGTNPKSLKVQQIQKNKNVTLYYFDSKTASYVTLQGFASIVNSKAEKQKYWKTAWENFYENTTTDYRLIKFTPNTATIISEKYHIVGDAITWKAPPLNLN